MRPVLFLINIFLMLISLSVSAQTIKGKVVDEDNVPVFYAGVSLMSHPDSTLKAISMTDTLGNYQFNTNGGIYYLQFESLGFDKTSSEVFEVPADATTIEVNTTTLKVKVNEIEGVTIRYQKPMIEKTSRGLTLNVESSPVLQSGNAKEVIEKVPGIIVNQDGSITLKGRTNVAIYIDEKRSFMSVENLMQWLESMPASDIEKVEVFDTPPAKYDASGASGLINVVLKKGAALGMNGNAGLGLGYGEFYKVTPSLGLNYRSRKFNAYGNFWSFADKTFDIYKSDYGLPTSGNDSTFFETRSKNIYDKSGFGGRAGLDIFLDKKNTIGFLLSSYNGGFGNSPDQNDTYLSGDNPYTYDYIKATFDNSVYWNGKGINLNYKHEFSEKESITFDTDFLFRNWGFEQDLTNNRFQGDVVIPSSILQSKSDTKVRVNVAKVDYEKELKNKLSIEAGLKGTMVNTRSDNRQETIDELTNYYNKDENEFEYDENVYASYASVVKKWDKWEGDVGLRMEYTFSEGYSATLDSVVKRDYLDFFPNISLKRVLSEGLDLNVSYTRRINRPNYGSLNPFEYQQSEFASYKGNPFLNPQYANTFNLGISIENAAFFTVGYTNTTDAMTRVKFQKEGEQTITETELNLENIYNLNFNVVVPIPIKKWWVFNFNGSTYYNQQTSQFSEGTIDNRLWTYTLHMQQIFTLPKKFKLEFSGYYNSSQYWNTFFVEPVYQLDFGVSKELGRFNLNLAFQDFLNMRESYGFNQQDNLRINYYYTWETRRVRLNIDYTFGNSKVKGARSRESSSKEEQSRAQ